MNSKLKMSLCLLLTAALLAGCTGGGGTPSAPSSAAPSSSGASAKAPEPSGSAEPAPAELPPQTEPVQILMVEVNKDGYEASDNDQVKAYIEEKSGVKFEITLAKDESDLATKGNLKLASNEALDLVQTTYGQFAMVDLVQRGVLMPLNEHLERYGQDILREFPFEETMKCVTDQDGNIWAIPRYQGRMGNTFYIRSDWREAVGITKQPETIEELEEYLRAVKDKDFDGNGQADTYPIITKAYTEFDWTLLSLYLGFSGKPDANYIDAAGNVTPLVMHPKYRDYLEKLASWHAEGLIYPEIYSLKTDQRNDLIAGNHVGGGVGWYSDVIRPWETLTKTVPEANYEYLTMKNVDGTAAKISRNAPGSAGMSVVSYAKNPERAVMLMNWTVQTPENYLVTRQGVPGVHISWENDAKTLWNDLKEPGKLIYKGAYSLSMNEVVADNYKPNTPFGWVDQKYEDTKVFMTDIGYQWNEDWYVIYNLKGTGLENSITDARTLLEEVKTKIIIGQLPITAWDDAIAQYRAMFGDSYVKFATETYGKYN